MSSLTLEDKLRRLCERQMATLSQDARVQQELSMFVPLQCSQTREITDNTPLLDLRKEVSGWARERVRTNESARGD